MTQLLAAAADEAVVERVVLEPIDCPTAPYGLVDEYRLIVYPVVLGSGKRLFGAETATLDLVETRPFATGATGLVYRPAA